MLHIFFLNLPGLIGVLAPLLLIHLIARIPRPASNLGGMQTGNPLLASADARTSDETFTPSLLLLTRSQEPKDLRPVALGVRFMPVELTAPILKHCARSADTELQLYAQTVMADGQEKLQQSFLQLRERAALNAPTDIASFIKAGLRLLDSPLTPDSEHASLFKNLLPSAEVTLSRNEKHPRLVFEAARLFTRARRMDDAHVLRKRLSPGSPLHEELGGLIAHHSSILAAQSRPILEKVMP